ncbi:MAG: hypothetical protein Q4C60_01470 [Eubacteriales bacterium]|nr:hypothetical protein [Eubacteriales bacterium]
MAGKESGMEEHRQNTGIHLSDETGSRPNRGKRTALLVLLAAILIFAACLALRPWYLDYMERDHRETCEKARFVIEDRYYYAVEDEREAGKSEEEIDYEAVLRRVVQENMEVTLDDELRCTGLCRSGGSYTCYIDPQTHRVTITCDYGDHGAYTF